MCRETTGDDWPTYTGDGYVCICVYVYVLCIHAGCYPVCLMSAQAMVLVRGRKPVATPVYVYMCVHVQIYMRMQSHPRSKLSKGTTIEGANWRGDRKIGRTSRNRGEREREREKAKGAERLSENLSTWTDVVSYH